MADDIDLPPLPDHPEPHTHRWIDTERRAIEQWGRECVAAAVAAERARVPDGLLDRVKAAEQRIRDNHAPRRIPADPTDVDLVLAEVRMLFEGEWPPFWIHDAPASPPADAQARLPAYDPHGPNLWRNAALSGGTQELPPGDWPADAQAEAREAVLMLTRAEVDRARQWFDSVEDTNPAYLEPADAVLALKLFEFVGLRPSNSLRERAAMQAERGETKA